MKALLVVLYVVLGLFQFVATVDGLKLWLDIGTWLAVLSAIVVAWLPLIGTVAGVVGAHHAWHWSWVGAIALFFGPQIVILVLALVIN